MGATRVFIILEGLSQLVTVVVCILCSLQRINRDNARFIGFFQACISKYCLLYSQMVSIRVRVFNDTFNPISVISGRSVLLKDQTGRPTENNRPVTSH